MGMQVHEVMTVAVVTVTSEMPVEAAAGLLIPFRFAGLPVVDADCRLVGIVTAEGLAGTSHPGNHATAGDADKRPVAASRTVANVMTAPGLTTSPWRDVTDLAITMIAMNVHTVPVVDDDRVVGIVTHDDVIRAYMHGDDIIAADPAPGF
jgi:CBS-domain-containing membrane protein